MLYSYNTIFAKIWVNYNRAYQLLEYDTHIEKTEVKSNRDKL